MKTFKFIDLFAGIGGFRVGLKSLGGKCVFSSEIDAKAKITYLANFKVFIDLSTIHQNAVDNFLRPRLLTTYPQTYQQPVDNRNHLKSLKKTDLSTDLSTISRAY